MHDALSRLGDAELVLGGRGGGRSTPSRSWPTPCSSAACSAATTAGARLSPARLRGLVQDHRWPAWRPRTLFSAAGAGGVALTYWALRKAGMETAPGRLPDGRVPRAAVLASTCCGPDRLRRAAAHRRAATATRPLGGTIVPARDRRRALLVVVGLLALIPGDLERRHRAASRRAPAQRAHGSRALATGPATVATGMRTALAYLRHPRRGALAIGGAFGYWAGQHWESCGRASTRSAVSVPFGVVVMGFFVGMAANLAPSPAAGVGTLDAGLIGAFLLFGIRRATPSSRRCWRSVSSASGCRSCRVWSHTSGSAGW